MIRSTWSFTNMEQNKASVQLNVLRQVEDMTKIHILELGPIMEDYDGGQKEAYEKVLNDINAYRAIIKHTTSYADQQEAGVDY